MRGDDMDDADNKPDSMLPQEEAGENRLPLVEGEALPDIPLQREKVCQKIIQLIRQQPNWSLVKDLSLTRTSLQ